MEILKSGYDDETEYWLSDDKIIMVRNDDSEVMRYRDIPRVSERYIEEIRNELMSIYRNKTGEKQSIQEKNAEARCKGMSYGKLQAMKYLERMKEDEKLL